MSPGEQAVERVFALWRVDDEWSVWDSIGFGWLGHRLWQSVSFQEDGELTLLWAETLLVREVADPAVALALVSSCNHRTPTLALIYDEAAREIRAVTQTSMTGFYYPTVMRFSDGALRQLMLAEQWVDGLVKATGGAIALAAHPQAGVRNTADDMLSMLAVFALRPEHVIDGPDIQPGLPALEAKILEGLSLSRGEDYDSLHSDGLDFEFPLYRRDFPLALRVYVVRSQPLHGTGPGLGLRVSSPPLNTDEQSLRRVANELNLETAQEGSQLVGAWVTDGSLLQYRAFIPHPVLKGAVSLDPENDGIEIIDAFLRLSCFRPGDRLVSKLNQLGLRPQETSETRERRTPVTVAAIGELADVVQAGGPPESDGLTWLFAHDPDLELGVWGIFNPVGPTLTQIGLIDVGDGRHLFVEWMRHPFSAEARALGVVPELSEAALEQLFDEFIVQARRQDWQGAVPGAFPEFVIPPRLGAEALRAAFLTAAAEETNEDLALEAARYFYYSGDAWARLMNQGSPPQPSEGGRAPNVAATWWSAVTDLRHVAGHVRAFPEAWDGAIKFLEDARNGYGE